MKILFAFPSRSRPHKFRVTLQKLVDSIIHPELCCINVVVDDNDPRRAEYMAVVEEYRSRINILTPSGNSTCKIDAVNRAAQCESFAWDIVVVMSDDMHVCMHGIDERVRRDMQQYYPKLDGLLHYKDGSANEKLITFAIMGRKFYDLFGYVYNPAYKSLWCDNEQMEVADLLGRRVYIPLQIVEHKHPANGARYARENDAQYKHTESFWNEDKATFMHRKSNWFDLPLLTICIPTVEGREDKFYRLSADLHKQRDRLPRRSAVEIIYDRDNKEKSIGQKRDDLLRRAKGLFVQMTDDDDMLAPNALYTWVYLIETMRGLTNIGFIERCELDDGKGCQADRSARYTDWADNVNGFGFVRTPDNKNPIRTSLCIAAGGYADMRYGEDHEFSKRVLPYLTNEAYVKQELYYYQYQKEEHNQKYGIK